MATTLDPCQLVTRSDAAALSGVSFGAGKEETDGNAKRCTYGGQTMNVFTVEVVQAASATIAQNYWAQAQAEASTKIKSQLPPSIHATLDTSNADGIGDRAATLSGSATVPQVGRVGMSGIYVLKGAVFFAFQDLAIGASAPSVAAMKSEARTILGRLP